MLEASGPPARPESARSPAVSVIVTTYNRAALLARAMESALRQTWQDLEVIVVDDASTDDTEAVVRAFADPRVRYIRHARNQGAVAAYNTGIQAARGTMVTFLDSDDTIRTNFLERQIPALSADSRIGMVWGWVRVHAADGRSSAIMYRNPFRSTPRELLPIMLKWTPGIGSVLIRREVFDEVGLLDPDVGTLLDVDFAARFALTGKYTVDIVPEVLMDVYKHPEGLSSHIHDRYLAQVQHYVKKHERELARYPCVHADFLYRIARVSERLGRDDADQSYAAAIRLCPTNVRYRLYPLARKWHLLAAWRRLASLRDGLRGWVRELRHGGRPHS